MRAVGEELGAERRLIFENVANGVLLENIMAVFHRSEVEVLNEARIVGRKINEYLFRRLSEGSAHAQPVIPCDTHHDIRANRMALFRVLKKLGNIYLSSPLLIPKLNIQTVDEDHPDTMREISHRLANA